MNTGATFHSAARVGCDGARNSSTMMVTMMAITPSLKASSRPVVISRWGIRRIYHGGAPRRPGGEPGSHWLLLRHAVHRAQAPNEISRINRDDFTGRKQVSQRVESDAIVAPVENGGEHHSICDVEIRVTSREAPSFEDDRLRHGEFDHGELSAILIAGGLQTPQVGAQRSVVHVVRIRLDHRNNGVFR